VVHDEPDEVARYAAAVRSALSDLPETARTELVEDLENHLREVLAEAGGSPTERFGTPAAYSAELRASAGLENLMPRRLRARTVVGKSWPVRVLGRAYAAARDHPFGRAMRHFLLSLRPAWWVLRGYLAVQLLSPFAGDAVAFPIPSL
jgi:hypothetical protein